MTSLEQPGTPAKKRVVVEMLGGVVQDVFADEGIEVIVVDWDDHETAGDDCACEFRAFPLSAMPDETEEQVAKIG